MGVLESCEGYDPSLRVSLDDRVFRDSNVPGHLPEDYYFKRSKVRLLGDLLNRKGQTKTQFILQTFLNNRGSKVINMPLKIYQSSGEFLEKMGNRFRIQTPVEDPNCLGERLFVGKMSGKPGELMIKSIPFNRYDDEAFKRGLYQVAMLSRILTEENNRFGYVYTDAFVVQSGLDKDKDDKSLIILGQAASATLHEVINFRKVTKMPWTESQFENLCYQLVRGVAELHSRGIAHRDIRPHNFVYCPLKRSFVLGGMQNSTPADTDFKTGLNLCGVPYYLPPYLAEIGRRQDYSEYYNYDPFRNDTYALAVTLMNCLFLDVFTSPAVLGQSLKKYYSKYGFLRLIKDMTGDTPPKLKDVLTTLSIKQGWIDEKTNIEALRYRMKPQDDEFVNRKRVIADGYYSMFLYDQWVEEINQVVGYYEMNRNHMALGDVYKQIADIYHDHDQQQLMRDYYHKASSTYLTISQGCFSEGKTEESIGYLQKGIDANRKGHQNAPNHDLAHLLNKLALAFHKKGDYQVSRAFQEESVDIIGKVYGLDTPQYAQMLIDSARIESQFQEFKQAENMLKAGLKIMDKKEDNAQNIRIRAKLLEALGSNYRMKALERRDKSDLYRRKGQECLLDALEMTEQVEGNISPHVGCILMSLGNIYFDKREFDQARKSYEKALIIKQHTQNRQDTVEVGECLTYLANSQKCLRDYDKAIRHYDEAIEVFRRAYGNDHNENTAVAIGNLGLVYKELGQREQERQFLSLAKTILRDLFGEQCPDYQYFERQSRS